ncbi:MAG: hypothetical protein Q9195_005434 [Heterodermia aff. obscurata]
MRKAQIPPTWEMQCFDFCPMMRELVKSDVFVGLRLPSDAIQVVRVVPNTSISIGKYGSFCANHIIGRPYHLTFEVLDKSNDSPAQSGLRIISASELYADLRDGEASTPSESNDPDVPEGNSGVEYELVGEDGEVVLRTNRAIIDDSSSQTMTMAQIEALKAEGTGSGRDLIQKILDSHIALDQKTAFALAKYTLRKTKKYLRRFTVLPVDVPLLAHWVLTDKEPMKIMELREETLALMSSLSNLHCTAIDSAPDEHQSGIGSGRWLMIDETSGLLVASTAEKIGVLYPQNTQGPSIVDDENQQANGHADDTATGNPGIPQQSIVPRIHSSSSLAHSNTITVIHANSQPNLALLKYFGFDNANPTPSHPLSRHLRTLSWLQLLAPEDDLACREPDTFPNETIQSWKSGRRGNYYRKRRRWERIKSIVDETRAGGFDGLMIATGMDLTTVLHHTVPLLRGGTQVVIYSPTVEPLVELSDYYSLGRRTAFITDPPEPDSMPTEDFPLDPTLLLAATIHTVKCRPWQVLPGRTHPLMTGRGSSEGYVFTATRVLPAEGKIEARGKFKRRKVNDGNISRGLEKPGQTLEPVGRKLGDGSETNIS